VLSPALRAWRALLCIHRVARLCRRGGFPGASLTLNNCHGCVRHLARRAYGNYIMLKHSYAINWPDKLLRSLLSF